MNTTPARRIAGVIERLKLRQLRLIVAVGERGSILHASRALNVSQPATTTLIRELETDLGVALFLRSNRGVLPTPLGDTLIRSARLVLNQMSRAAQELSDLRDGTGGHLAVGTLLSASAALLPSAIMRVVEAHRGLNVQLVEGTNEQLIPALRSGQLDMVVGRLPMLRYRRELVQETLYQGAMIVVCRPGHPVQGRGPVPLRDLLRWRWILPPPDTTLRRQVEDAFHARGLELPESSIESVSFLTNRELLRNSDLIGMFPNHIADTDIAAGSIVRVETEMPVPVSPIGVSHLGEAELSPAAASFLRALRQESARLAALQAESRPGEGAPPATPPDAA